MLYANQELHQNLETYLSFDDIRQDRRFDRPFRPTFYSNVDFVDGRHKALVTDPTNPETHMIDIGIDGWLLPADAGKLYELAMFSVGPILEIGTFKGLSTSIIAESVHNSKRPRQIVTVDLSPANISQAAIGMGERATPGRQNVHFYVNEGAAFLRFAAQQKMNFGFAFIDHSHRFEHVKSVVEELPTVLAPGAFVVFHDYNDPRNPSERDQNFGVYQALDQSAATSDLEFWGIFGCCGLFRFVPK
ncbi:MAG: class I SAM-dependent methyltransferase [Paracoccaceae bacterium]